MPSDIRSFFAARSGNSTAASSKQSTPTTTTSPSSAPSGKRAAKSAVAEKPSKPTASRTTKAEKSKPAAETVTTTTEYFGAAKPKRRSTRLSTGGDAESSTAPAAALPASPVVAPKPKQTRPSKPASRLVVDGGADEDDDIFMADYAGRTKADDYNDGSDDDMLPKAADTPAQSEDSDLDVVLPRARRAKTTTAAASKAPPKPTRTARKPAGEPEQDDDIASVMESIPQVRLPTPPAGTSAPAKFNYAAVASRTASTGTVSSAELPTGADNCLAGLTFVFTGILKTIERTEAQALVKRYGGRVTGAPSKKTSFVVLGDDAGPKKIESIRANGIKVVDENGLFDLIRKMPAHGGNGKEAVKFRQQQADAEAAVRRQAAELDAAEAAAQKKIEKTIQTDSRAATTPSSSAAPRPSTDPAAKLWTSKYAPTQLGQICGNKGVVAKLQAWLHNFGRARASGFKKPGADGSGIYRAVMIHGPPGIGKTTAAHLVAKLEGFDVVESNASDSRSKKLVEETVRGVLGTTSLLGYFAGDGQKVDKSKRKLVLIMDEVDGMSAGDRGGVGALAAVCKKSDIPVILICNDRRLPKMKPFDHVTLDMPFRRPTTDQIRSRISTIAFREKLKMPPAVIDALIEGSSADIRQIINMLSAAKMDSLVPSGPAAMDHDAGRAMAKAWEKHVMLKPWDIAAKILCSGMFEPSSSATLNSMSELYFNDHEFSPLMIQENYLSTMPTEATRSANPGRSRNLRALELATRAAESISDGDLVDRLIHGTQQHWSLMPTHAIFAFVRPASYIAGPIRQGRRIEFTQWLGKNSAQQKKARMLKEMQARVRLTGGGDRAEMRMNYMPAFWARMPKRLEVQGKEAVEPVIDLMDSYFLVRDDFDAVLELGIGHMGDGTAGVKIDKAAKAAFTRIYNQKNHPIAYLKADPASARAMPIAKDPAPDLEEAVEESDGGEDDNDAGKSVKDDKDALAKDKFIRQPKKKPAAASGAGRTKRKVADADLSPDDSASSAPVRKPAKRATRAKK